MTLHQQRKQSVALIKERAAALEQAVAMLQRGIDDSRAQALLRKLKLNTCVRNIVLS